MKRNNKWLIVLILISINTISKAQVSYFANENFSEKLAILKTTTTLFTIQYKDYAELEKFEQAIKKTWTITPYKIIKPEELAAYDKLENYSFFYFDAFNETGDSTTNVNIVYALKLITPSKIPKQRDETVFAYTTLFTDAYTNLLVKEEGEKLRKRKNKKAKILNFLYNNSKFLNWSPGFLSGYLKQINDGLLSNSIRQLDFQFYNKIRLPELKKDTLYVPEYVREIFSSQKRLVNETTAPQKPYSYKLEFVSSAVLDSLILNKDKGIKYLVFTQRSNDKIISIYDSKDNRIIYQMFSFQFPYFEMDDLNRIKEIIEAIK